MITAEQKQRATAALRAAGFNPAECRELLAGPKGLRDEFAGQLMAALIVANGGKGRTLHASDFARDAYAGADALMIERGGA